MEKNDSSENRAIKLFHNKTFLITGGSGFIGKVLIEKLLRCCSNLKKIYVIARDKKGMNPKERFEEIFNGPLFDLLRKERGESIFSKVDAIFGDVTILGLGLSSKDKKKLTEEVDFIYHNAATIRFDEFFKHTVLLNVRGTKLMLDLAKECKNLKCFLYTSTAYCHEEEKILYEKFYPPPTNPHLIIHLCEEMDENIIEKMSEHLRNNCANNYSFSKALAEALVEEQIDNLPVAIVRPSAVISVWKEPLPGWIDNIHGPAGLFAGAAAGLIRTMYARDDIFVDVMPVDLVVNSLILAVGDMYTYGTQRVYNVTGTEEIRELGITAKNIIDIGREVINNRVAFNLVLWYPNGSLTQSRIKHYLKFVMFQLLPAMFVDAVLYIIGYKPFLFKIQKRIWKGYQIFEFYANREWTFDAELSRRRRNMLTSEEKRLFKVDRDGLDFYEYLTNATIAFRRYMLNQPDEDIPLALRRMKILRYLDLFCKTVLVVGVLYLFFRW